MKPLSLGNECKKRKRIKLKWRIRGSFCVLRYGGWCGVIAAGESMWMGFWHKRAVWYMSLHVLVRNCMVDISHVRPTTKEEEQIGFDTQWTSCLYINWEHFIPAPQQYFIFFWWDITIITLFLKSKNSECCRVV